MKHRLLLLYLSRFFIYLYCTCVLRLSFIPFVNKYPYFRLLKLAVSPLPDLSGAHAFVDLL